MKPTVRVLVVAPDELSRAGLLRMLAGTHYRPVAASIWDSHPVLGKRSPELIIASSVDSAGAAVCASTVEAMAQRCKVVVLADRCDTELCRRMIRAGAAAYLPRSISADALLQALDLIQGGSLVVPLSLARQVLSCSNDNSDDPRQDVADDAASAQRDGLLSTREIEILRLLIQGDSNKRISRRLSIAETTVKVHVKAILRKLKVSNRTQAAIWGLEYLPARHQRSDQLDDVAITPQGYLSEHESVAGIPRTVEAPSHYDIGVDADGDLDPTDAGADALRAAGRHQRERHS